VGGTRKVASSCIVNLQCASGPGKGAKILIGLDRNSGGREKKWEKGKGSAKN